MTVLDHALTDVLALRVHLLDSFADFTFGEIDVILGRSRIIHERECARIIIYIELDGMLVLFDPARHSYQSEFPSTDVGNLHVVCRRRQFFEFLAREDVDSGQVDFCMTVLASLRGGHIDDFAWSALDHDETVLSECGTLHGEGLSCTCICRLNAEIFLLDGIVSF